MTQQDIINKGGLQMAHYIIGTKPGLDLGDDKELCPFCEAKELKSGVRTAIKLDDFMHNYGCVYLTTVLYKADILNEYGIE